MKKSRLGIFGGAFNPVHFGHLFIAKEAVRTFSLEKVIFVPTGNPVFKKEDLIDKTARAHLVELSLSEENNFELSLYEVEKDTPSFFIETLFYFKTVFPNKEFFSIIGEDAFLKFHLWKEPELILKNTNLIVAKRFYGNFETSKEYMFKYFRTFQDKIFFMDNLLFPISSTVIRRRIAEKKPISYLLPKSVEREIIKNGYYRKDKI